MGEWAQQEMGRPNLPRICFLFAGTTPKKQKEKVLSYFDKIELHRHDVYERYIASYKNKEYLILFQIYGAQVITDVTHILNDGGVEEIIFIGAAFGIQGDLKIGDYIIPDQVQALDGLLKINFDIDYSYPDENLTHQIKAILQKNNEKYIKGKTVSVPSTFAQPDNSRHDQDVIALEMEFSSLCYFADKLNMKSAGVLVVSDTADHSLLDEQKLRYKNIIKVFKIIIQELD